MIFLCLFGVAGDRQNGEETVTDLKTDKSFF